MRKATRIYRTYSIPGKTAALVPEFAVETCLRQNCSLGPALAEKDLLLAKTLYDDVGGGDDDDDICNLSV